MNRSNHHSQHDDEAIDQLLDQYWDQVVAGEQPRRNTEHLLDPELAATIHHLHTHDDSQRPSAAFVHHLRKELTMTTINPISLSPQGATDHIRVPRSRARPKPLQTPRWRPILELVAAAVLIFALIGGFFGPNQSFFGISSFWQHDQSVDPVGMLAGNAARTGEMPGPGPEGQPSLRWKVHPFGDDHGSFTSPIVAGDTAYLLGQRQDSTDGTTISSLSAVNISTGAIRWSVDLAGMDVGTPSVANGLVYVGVRFYAVPDANLATPAPYPTSPGALIAFDATSGIEVWRHTMPAAEIYSPAVADGVVYINSVDGSITALDGLTGAARWRTSLGGDGAFTSSASSAVVNGIVYTANSDGVLSALDANSGDIIWVAQTTGDLLRTPVVSDGVVYIASTAFSENERSSPHKSWLTALQANNGTELWTREVGAKLYSPPITSGGRVYLVSNPISASLTAYDAATGNIDWTLTGIGTPPTIAGDILYTASNDTNRLHAIAAATGQNLWDVQLSGGIMGAPAVADGMVLVSTSDGALYAIGGSVVQSGTPEATPLVDGDASGLPICSIQPRADWTLLHLTGDPAHTIVPVTDLQQHGQPAAARKDDVPTGQPAAANTISAIQETVIQTQACGQRGLDQAAAAFFSDDFFRRPWVAASLNFNYATSGYSLVVGLFDGISASDITIDTSRVLPDGRVGILVSSPDSSYGRFLVFADHDGQWLLDEWIEITDHPESRG